MNTVSFIGLYAFTGLIPCLALLYLFLPALDERERTVKRRYAIFLLVSAAAIAAGGFQGIEYRHHHLVPDLLDLVTLSCAPGAAMSLAWLQRKPRMLLCLNGMLLSACLFILLSYLFMGNRGLIGSFLRGNSVSTRYSVFFLAFYGAILVATRVSPRIGHGFVFIGVTMAALAFGKWTLPVPMILIPTLFIVTGKQTVGRRRHIAFVAGLGALLVWMVFLTPIPNMLSQRIGYSSFQAYWRARVVNQQESSTIPFLGTEIALRSGGRFEMWEDIISRTLKSPLTGIGIGARPSLFVNPYDVNAHNLFITLLGSFGIPLFFAYMLSLGSFLQSIRRTLFSAHARVVFWSWMLYLAFTLNIGLAYEAPFNQLFMCLPLGIMLMEWRRFVLFRRFQTIRPNACSGGPQPDPALQVKQP